MIVSQAGYVVIVRDVLGRDAEADIERGDGFPWFNCPFCSSGVYLGAASPEALAVSATRAQHGECNNPWCVANPAMPIDKAREIVAKAEREHAEREARQRDHRLALQRHEEWRRAERDARTATITKATAGGFCVPCALKRGKFMKHRNGCPNINA